MSDASAYDWCVENPYSVQVAKSELDSTNIVGMLAMLCRMCSMPMTLSWKVVKPLGQVIVETNWKGAPLSQSVESVVSTTTGEYEGHLRDGICIQADTYSSPTVVPILVLQDSFA